ncbi:MAG: carboxypeptidase regulatory-like domain-containing protein [Chloroflexi bacterium]|nr:carboxypeptidase regulatory-like domain-containing protein [Chloroflexota bacterium]
MKKLRYLTILFLLATLAFPISAASAENGVDDLRGRWDIQWAFNGEDPAPPLILYVNATRASTVAANTFYANGCMRSSDTNALMPLSLRAIYNPTANSYEVIVLSTMVPPQGEPFVIRFNGTVAVNGESVKDDKSQGTLITEFARGTWNGIHHDRRVTKCPSVQDSGLGFQGDLYTHRDLGYTTPRNWTVYEGYTIIVSSGMLVQAPDGTSFVVQEYSDIFSPDVDFVGRFRYLSHLEGLPISGGVYKFSLLDIFGDPIPGTESTDVWRACNQGAPSNIGASYTYEDNVSLTWDPVTAVPGQFDPGGTPQVGYYQIGISPFNWPGAGDYGSAWVASPTHIIPWNSFEPGSNGLPNGFDFGMALGQLPDGDYQVGLYAFSWPAPNTGGFEHECMVFDSSESLIMSKQESNLNFQQMASISGRVTDEDGAPLSGAGVGACPYFGTDPMTCYGDQSNANGEYTIFLPAGIYRVNVGGMENWANEFYNNTPDWNLAFQVTTLAGANTPHIDFSLAPAGTISGRVYDWQGNPLANIAVDTEYGGSGTCTDENGQYTLFGVPYGTHRVSAGRDFCGPHPYAEQLSGEVVIDADSPHVGGLDFYLELIP